MSQKLSIAECDRIITAKGQLLEIEEKSLNGRTYRVWKNLPATFREYILDKCQTYNGRTFLSSPMPLAQGTSAREEIKFGQALEQALTLASWMRSRGLGAGSRVAIGGGNCTGWIISWIATHLIGGVIVALNAWLTRDALVHCVKITKPELVLIDEERVEVLGPVTSGLCESGVGEIFCWSPTSHIASSSRCSIKALDGSITEIDQKARTHILKGKGNGLEDLGPESDAVIFFTSGTGGLPKAVLSTQRMALSNVFSGFVAPYRSALRAGQPLPPALKPTDPQRVVLLAVPLFHVTGNLSWLMRALYAGSKMVFLRKWDVKEAVRLIVEQRVTVIGGVPAVVAALVQSPDLPKTQTFDTVFYGGAPPSKQLAAEVKAAWPKAGLIQGYGMTETNAYVCSIAGADYVERPDSTGPPVPICDTRIVDPTTDQEVPVGQSGVLKVRGPQVMSCYVGDEAATRKTIDNEGWLDTGDVACVDTEGFVYIKDRLKDIIIRGGENIASADVENALYADPRVSEVAAIGVPHERLGEVVGTVVSLRREHAGTASERDLMEEVKPRLAKFAWPAIILIHEGPLPRNVNGKLVKKDLKPLLVEAWGLRQGAVVNDVRAKL